MGLMQAAFQAGIAMPDRLSIIGFDDIDFAPYTIPPLTTISQSGVEMGRIATEVLLDMIDNAATAPRSATSSSARSSSSGDRPRRHSLRGLSGRTRPRLSSAGGGPTWPNIVRRTVNDKMDLIGSREALCQPYSANSDLSRAAPGASRLPRVSRPTSAAHVDEARARHGGGPAGSPYQSRRPFEALKI